MPKVKKIRAPALQTTTTSQQQQHEQPLGQTIQDDTNRTLYAKAIKSKDLGKKKKHREGSEIMNTDDVDDDDVSRGNVDDDDNVLDTKSSQRIMALSIEQQTEIRQLENISKFTKSSNAVGRLQQKSRTTAVATNKTTMNDDSDDDDDDDEDNDRRLTDKINDDNDDDDCYIDRIDNGAYVDMVDSTLLGISPEDEAIIATMMKGRHRSSNNDNDNDATTTTELHPPKQQQQKTLSDMILEKIAQKEQEQQQQHGRDGDAISQHQEEQELPPKVIEVYTDIGKILSRYTSGKLPKAFKVIPSLSNWEEVLYITRPDLWTPSAMYAATRIFASNCNVKMATKFYHLVLLDSVRNDIHKQKKLNYHYYMSLKKSIYKPQSFFKGILLPLCHDGCTLREAAIVASVLQRVSIPVHHAAVAIHKLATMHRSNINSTSAAAATMTTTMAQLSEYSGATSIFLKTLFNKKYSLPAPVIQSVIQYFTNFLNYGTSNNNNNNTTTTTTIVLPVLWHQALLVFVQRYKNAIVTIGGSGDDDHSTTQQQQQQREVFRKLLKQHYHHKITPEIRRELFGNIQAYQEEQILQQQQQHHGSKSSTTTVPMTIDQRHPMEM